MLTETDSTQVGPHIGGLQHFDSEVLVYFAHDLDSVAHCKMGVLSGMSALQSKLWC